MKPRADSGECQPALGIVTQAAAYDLKKRRGQIRGDNRILLVVPHRHTLGQSLRERHTERPNVGGRGDRSARPFRRIVSVELCWWGRGSFWRAQPVTRNFELVSTCQNVRRLQMAMHDAAAMQVAQHVQRRLQQGKDFGWRESSL